MSSRKIPYRSRKQKCEFLSYYDVPLSHIKNRKNGSLFQRNLDISHYILPNLQKYLLNNDYEIRGDGIAYLEKKLALVNNCPDCVIDVFQEKSFGLNIEKISEYFDGEGTYDYNFHDALCCLIDSFLSKKGLPDHRFRRIINDIVKIGDGSNGLVFELNPIFAVKVAIEYKYDRLEHELFMGMEVLNKLRNKIPNFMHTYGAFRSSPPIVDKKNRVLSWDHSSVKPIFYLIIENIKNAQNLRYNIRDFTENEFLQIYLQILNAINVAYKEYDYTHYDLHARNILIKRLPDYISIPLYKADGSIVYIVTKLLVRIIDYGLSHAYAHGYHFGNYLHRYIDIDGESSFPIYDAYKLLLSAYIFSTEVNDILQQESNIASVASGIYHFFREGKTIRQRCLEYFKHKPNERDIKTDLKMHNCYINKIGEYQTDEERKNLLKEYNERNRYEEKFESRGIQRDFLHPSLIHKNITLDSLIDYIITKYKPDFIKEEIVGYATNKEFDESKVIELLFENLKLEETLEDYIQIKKMDIKDFPMFDVNSVYQQELTFNQLALNETIGRLSRVNLNKFKTEKEYISSLKFIIKYRSKVVCIKRWINLIEDSVHMKIIPYLADDLINLKLDIQRIKDIFTSFKIAVLSNRSKNSEISLMKSMIIEDF